MYTIHFLPSLPPFVLHVLPSLFLGLSLSPLLSLSGPIHVVTTRKGRRLWPLQWKVPSLCRSCRRVGQIQADFYLVVAATVCPRCSKFLCKFPVVKCFSYKNYWLMTILHKGREFILNVKNITFKRKNQLIIWGDHLTYETSMWSQIHDVLKIYSITWYVAQWISQGTWWELTDYIYCEHLDIQSKCRIN